MKNHVRNEHPAEPIQEDEDAEYYASEEDTEEGREDPQHPHREPTDLDQRNQSVGAPNQYNRSLWRLPGSTLQRSLTDPYPTEPTHFSDYSSIRADTMPHGLPQAPASAGVPTQYQLRHNGNMGIWSTRSLQDSPTSFTDSSSISAIPRPLFASQCYQFQQFSIPESTSYPDLQKTVRNLEQLKVGQSQLHQYGGLQDPYTDLCREASQHQSYNGTQAQTVTQHYQSDMPPTPAPTQSMPQYTAPLQEVPPQLLCPQTTTLLSATNTFYPIYNDGMDGKVVVKPEDYQTLMPNQRVQEIDWPMG